MKDIKITLKVIFLLLFLVVSSNSKSQNIISRTASDYPEGSLNSSCLSSPYTGCVITLPPAKYGESYTFTIPLKTGITRSAISFIFTQISNCSEGSIGFTSDGKVEMISASSCFPEISNFIEIDLETINNGDGSSDRQKFQLPILRNPIKVVLVLDISSKMSLQVPGGTDTRWSVLKKSATLFVKEFEKYHQEEDSISVVYYAKDIVTPNPPIGDDFIAITPENHLPTNLKSSEIIQSDLLSQTLKDSSAMGKALLLAKSKLVNSDATKIVLLFTDGYQDVKPLVTKFGNKLTNSEFLSNGPCNKLDSIRYYTIGMGDITLLPEVLKEIADANGGVNLSTTTGNDEGELYNFFQNQFSDLLRGIAEPVGSRIIDLTPFDDTLHVTLSAKIALTFNQDMFVNTGSVRIKRYLDDSDFELINVTSGNVTGGGTSKITIDPINNFESNTKYYILIDNGAFRNSKNQPYGISSKTFWNFTTYNNLTNVDELREEDISVYSENGYVTISILKPIPLNSNSYVEIYSFNGSLIKKEEIGNASFFRTYLGEKQEIYIVKLSINQQIYTTKIMVR